MKGTVVFRLMLSALVLVGLTNCEKDPGEGGTSTIKGKVFVNDYTNVGTLSASFYGPEERVYIVYGDNDIYDDDTRTDPDGEYKFEYLQKGSYTVFAYSDCDTCASGTESISLSVEITDKDQVLNLNDLVVRR